MPDHSRRFRTTRLDRLLGWARAALGGRPRPRIEVLLVDRGERRAIAREVRGALSGLTRATGVPLPEGFAVVVQQTVYGGWALAGCRHVGRRADGAPLALVRLALQVEDRRVGPDELLAELAEQVVALTLGGDGAGVPVPLDGHPDTQPTAAGDPLLPHPNGCGPRPGRPD